VLLVRRGNGECEAGVGEVRMTRTGTAKEPGRTQGEAVLAWRTLGVVVAEIPMPIAEPDRGGNDWRKIRLEMICAHASSGLDELRHHSDKARRMSGRAPASSG